MKTIAAIDLFAGPGGLNEGFGRFADKDIRFDVRLSIEKDSVACRTLKLRAFYRQFQGRALPEAFYDYIRGDQSQQQKLAALPEWAIAEAHVRQWALGSAKGDPGYVSLLDLHTTINDSLIGAGDQWVLLGGPPCQAYSIIGRARMMGVGAKVRNTGDADEMEASRKLLASEFADDHRHTLYREYLRVVAVHQPAAFIMENVKGILSAKILAKTDIHGKPGKPTHVFDQIQKDLRAPWDAIAGDPDYQSLKALSLQFGRKSHAYRLYPFATQEADKWAGLKGTDFVIRAEQFGVPQTRHRVIVLGVRDDIAPAHTPLTEAKSTTTVHDIIGNMPRLRSGVSTDAETIEKYGKDSSENWHSALRGESKTMLESLQDKRLIKAIKSAVEGAKTVTLRGSVFVKGKSPLSSLPAPLRALMEDPRLGGVIQHQTRSHMASDLARYLYLSASANNPEVDHQQTPTLDEWPKSLLPKHANVRYVGPRRVVDGFFDRFRVQTWHRPSSTVMAHLQKDGHYYIHPDPSQCRCLTVREAARLQTFPENYFFEGNISQQFLQVGNAVPPYLALQLANSVASLFRVSSVQQRI